VSTGATRDPWNLGIQFLKRTLAKVKEVLHTSSLFQLANSEAGCRSVVVVCYTATQALR
jgi:hypothetical protein